jgi:hypothetical protein
LFIKLLTSTVLIKLLDLDPNPNQEQKFQIRIRQKKKLGSSRIRIRIGNTGSHTWKCVGSSGTRPQIRSSEKLKWKKSMSRSQKRNASLQLVGHLKAQVIFTFFPTLILLELFNALTLSKIALKMF